MATSERQREANKRNAQFSRGPKDTSNTRYNALKHGYLSITALIRTGKGMEDPDEFKGFRDGLWADLAPRGALEEYFVDKMVDLAWRERRIPAYETAMISKQKDEAIKGWELEHPFTLAHNRWSTRQAPQKPAEEPVDPIIEKILRFNAAQPGGPANKDVSGPGIDPVTPYIVQLEMHRLTMRELADDQGVNSPGLRGVVCLVAQRMGVDVEGVLGPRPESQSVVDCSPEEAQQVIDAACELNDLTEIEFWDANWEEVDHRMMKAANALAEFEQERTRAGDAAGLLDENVLATLQRYEVHASKQFAKLLDRFQQLQTTRLSRRGLDSPEMGSES